MKPIIIAIIAAMVLCCLCSQMSTANGGDSGSASEVIAAQGVVVDSSGNRQGNALVKVRPADYLTPIEQGMAESAGTILDTVTDASGAFTIDSLVPGDYFIEVSDGLRCATLFQVTVKKGEAAHFLGTKKLEPFAQLAIIWKAAPQDSTTRYARIYGLDRLASVGSDSVFSFVNLPYGTYRMQFSSVKGHTTTTGILTITISPGRQSRTYFESSVTP
jgi:hypothetical protein